jgi:hypothetical protein
MDANREIYTKGLGRPDRMDKIHRIRKKDEKGLIFLALILCRQHGHGYPSC